MSESKPSETTTHESTAAGPMIKACVDRSLPVSALLPTSRAAIAENPDNAPVLPRGRGLPGAFIDAPVALAALTGKLWKPGRTLRVHFLDGDAEVQERLKPFAHQWSEYANIQFVFVNDPNAEIRISFQQAGSWSYIGTDALGIPKGQPTMNFGWLTKATANDEYSRVVTHEFGHAIGCIHEHQNPATNIPWNKEAVYDYYAGPPNNWTRQQTDINLFTRYSATLTQFSAFDRDSIMLYPIPNEFTIGDFEVGWNRVLSSMDKQFVATLYPGVQKLENELVVDAPPTKAAIGAFGEIDKFSFAVTTAGRYRMETEGNLDLVMGLFGPDNETLGITEDDDSGRRLNAKIVSELRPGVYTLKVRHFSGRRTGDYTVGVYQEP
ncbi:MAG: hypothetical protein KDE19_04830 [Caldilineaceae bacterium]|nr:hypothetical protein [Caldilineaceae bacterium]